jgi:hypothetical protein
MLLAAQFVFDIQTAFATQCRPRRPLPTIVLKTMGPCNFNPETLSFAGTPLEQASCLIRTPNRLAHLGPPLVELPRALTDRVSGAVATPDRASLRALIRDSSLPPQFAEGLDLDLSRARDNDPQAPMARYFVIHDTSGPRLSSFAKINENARINNLERFVCSDAAEIAHAFINRLGDVSSGHDFGVPWRSTKFERALSFGTSLKGLFLHVEMIQPRSRGRAPVPGFTEAQYQRLALLYTIAGARAGAWLIPVFHAVIDNDIRNGHDDPQNFEVEAFARALDGVTEQLAAYDATGRKTTGQADREPSLERQLPPADSHPGAE